MLFDGSVRGVEETVTRPSGSKKKPVYRPESDQGVEFMKLCMELRRHKRALVFIGGSGEQWKLSPPDAVKWDAMVSQFIGIAQMCGVMAVSGQEQYDRMTSAPDGTHFAMEHATLDFMVEMLQDGINALYGARPEGTFAWAQRLTGIAESSESSGILAAAAPLVSTRESEEAAAAIRAVNESIVAEVADMTGIVRVKYVKATPDMKEQHELFKAQQASMVSEPSGPASASASTPTIYAYLDWQRRRQPAEVRGRDGAQQQPSLPD